MGYPELIAAVAPALTGRAGVVRARGHPERSRGIRTGSLRSLESSPLMPANYRPPVLAVGAGALAPFTNVAVSTMSIICCAFACSFRKTK